MSVREPATPWKGEGTEGLYVCVPDPTGEIRLHKATRAGPAPSSLRSPHFRGINRP
ncbi:MAG: hypothetical protein Kow0092_33980 [Deferrisomatales bacterium]